MKQRAFVFTLESKEDFNFPLNLPKAEFIIRTSELSRWGTIPLADALDMVKRLPPTCPVFLEWDILMTEFEMKAVIKRLEEFDEAWWSRWTAVRVQDAGAFHYLKGRKLKNPIPLHLILESGNHNLAGILKWLELGGDQLKRLVLSRELSKQDLALFAANTKIELEYQVFGKIPLFYSPRSLLTPAIASQGPCSATSEESPHKGFSLLENQHGTYMWLPKELFLLDQLDELEQVGVKAFRVEGTEYLSWTDFDFSKLKIKLEEEGRVFIRGFFSVNKTDAIFRKLKNEALKKDQDKNLAVLIDVIKSRMLGLQITHTSHTLKVGQMVECLTPQGKKSQHRIFFIKNSKMEDVEEAKYQDIVYINFIRALTPQTLINMSDN